MEMEEHPGIHFPFLNPLINANHRFLNYIGGSPLNRRIDSYPLNQIPGFPVSAISFRYRPDPARKNGDATLYLGLLQGSFNVFLNSLVFLINKYYFFSSGVLLIIKRGLMRIIING
jgi:hypothetical protein